MSGRFTIQVVSARSAASEALTIHQEGTGLTRIVIAFSDLDSSARA
ncbi:hypothetical protein [Bifidobacterium indicum]